ncbi:MAG: FAD-dependent oxidoreductase [Lachnospiraceae bacterium]|nr:FAD-dependent oxidoreductase [Lachnospiraceae bacterium]
MITAHDLTGYFARFSSILLTDDFDDTPPHEVERIHLERARIRGLSTEPAFGGDYDLIVVGGGPGGVPASIAAAREGVRTLLIQNRPMLGGNASPEVGITMDGAGTDHVYARESGIAEEIRRLRDADPEYYGDWSRAMTKLANAEKNLTVVYNTHVCAAETEGSAIRAVTGMNLRTLTKTRFTGRVFMDCTGDAWLGYYAGAKYRYGREAKAEFGEDSAPDIADTLTMSGCIKSGNLSFFKVLDHPVSYHAPEWVPALPKTDREFNRGIPGKGNSLMWWLEVPNDYNDVWDGEETRDALLLVVLGYYDHAKNYWSGRARFQNSELHFSGIFNGRRESRRLIGDYILTEEDCVEGRAFEDTVSYTGWCLDVHHPRGIYSGIEGPSFCSKAIMQAKVPYRCLYSVNIENLLFAGRNISCTHMALGTVRLENTIAAIGQAAGTAAALCVKLNESPRGIYERHLRELQQLLIKNDQFIPGFKNEDPLDPCRTASVTASSCSRSEFYRAVHGTDGPFLPMDRPRRAAFNVMDPDHSDITSVSLYLRSDRPEPVQVQLRYDSAAYRAWSNYVFRGDHTVTAILPPGEHWVRFPIQMAAYKAKGSSRSIVQVHLDAAEGVYWRSLECLSFYDMRAEQREDGRWKEINGIGMAAFAGESPYLPANCAPENVINGYSRIIDPEQFEWVSDPAEPLPQWIELTFKKPAVIRSVRLVFDTDLSNPGTCWTCKRPAVPETVKDYVVEVGTAAGWVKTAEVRDNFMRKRVHEFEPIEAEKIRVTVLATNGDKSARITEIRAEEVI